MRSLRPDRFGFSGYDTPVDCPDGFGRLFADCLKCRQYRVWREGDAPRCRHDFERLKGQGYYTPGQEGWTDYLRNADPERYERLREEEENNRRVREWLEEDRQEQEAEAERWREEMEKHARECEKEQEEVDAEWEAVAREMEETDGAEESAESPAPRCEEEDLLDDEESGQEPEEDEELEDDSDGEDEDEDW